MSKGLDKYSKVAEFMGKIARITIAKKIYVTLKRYAMT